MTVESASFLHDLNSSLPAGSDPKSEGNDHIALVKAVAKATFPGMAGRAWRRQTKGGNYTLVATDNMTLLKFTATANLTLMPAATAGNGFMVLVYVNSGFSVNFVPDGSETINGVTSGSINNVDFGLLFSDGVEWYFAWIQSAADTGLTRPNFITPSETSATNATAGGSMAVNLASANILNWTLTSSISGITFSNPPASGRAFAVTFLLTQGGSGSYTVTWPAAVKWPGGVAPTLTTTVGKTDIITLLTVDAGATWFGFVGGQNF